MSPAPLTPQRRWDTAVISAGVVLMLAGAWVVRRAAARLSAERAEVAQLRTEADRLLQLRTSFVEPTRAESLAWVDAEADARALGTGPGDRLALARAVARLAEAAGMSAVQAQFVPSDTLEVQPRQAAPGVAFQPAPFALRLSATGSYDQVQRLIVSLPPSVTVKAVSARRTAAAPEYRLVLGVYLRPEGPS